MNGHTLQTGLIAKADSSILDTARTANKTASTGSTKLAAISFFFMMILALALGVSLVARADTKEPGLTAALPDSVEFMTGVVAITWTYRNQNSMPFTEHHSITSAQLADAIKSKGPIRVPTSNDGELIIASVEEAPNVVLIVRQYSDWSLISVLTNSNDPAHSVGYFKFCSVDVSDESCVRSVMSHPDGTVSMTTGSHGVADASMLIELDQTAVTNELLALMTL